MDTGFDFYKLDDLLDQEQRQRWLPAMAVLDKIGAFGMSGVGLYLRGQQRDQHAHRRPRNHRDQRGHLSQSI